MFPLFLLACAPESPVLTAPVEGGVDVPPAEPFPDPDPEPELIDPRPVSFHAIDGDDPAAWDALQYTYGFYGTTMLASVVRPLGVASDDWAALVQVGDDADLLVQTIDTLLLYERPHAVLVDGLDLESQSVIADAAIRLDLEHPHWRGRWGIRVPDSAVGYDALEPALLAVLDAGAIVLAELDVEPEAYCASATYPGGRDLWLSHRIRGEYGEPARLVWLEALHTELASDSRIVPTLQVSGRSPELLDRALYVYRTYSQFDALLELANGGPGSWVWGHEPERDDAFVDSYVHYAVEGRVTSRIGDFACP